MKNWDVPARPRVLAGHLNERFRCCGCGSCCQGWAVEVDTTAKGAIEKALAKKPHPEFGAALPIIEGSAGRTFLPMRDGRCVFLDADMRCWLHANLGENLKPAVCSFYPLRSVLTPEGHHMTLSPSCHTAAALVLGEEKTKFTERAVTSPPASVEPFTLDGETVLQAAEASLLERAVVRALEKPEGDFPRRILAARSLVDEYAARRAFGGAGDAKKLLEGNESRVSAFAPPALSEHVRILRSLVAHRGKLDGGGPRPAAFRKMFGALEDAFALSDENARPPGHVRLNRALTRHFFPEMAALNDPLVNWCRHQFLSRTFTQPFGVRDGLSVIAFLYALVRAYAAALAMKADAPVTQETLASAVAGAEREFTHSHIVMEFWGGILALPGARKIEFTAMLVG